jgi:hypothetical protein
MAITGIPTMRDQHLAQFHDVKVSNDVEITGALTVSGTFTYGDVSYDNMIITGRLTSATAAGSDITLASTFTYANSIKMRYSITSWTGIGDAYSAMYLRVQNAVSGTGKGQRVIEAISVSNATFSLGNLQCGYFEVGMKASGTQTIANANALEASLAPYTGTGAITITNHWECLLCTPSGVSSRIDASNAAKIHGVYVLCRDGDGANTKLGSGIEFVNDGSQSGTRTLTDGVKVNIACTTGLNVAGATTTGLLLAGTATDGILVSGACADGIHVSGTNSASGLHISGDQADFILLDIDAAADNGLKMSVDDSMTLGTGINIAKTGTTGITTTGIVVSTNCTTGLSLSGTNTTGVSIANTNATGINFAGGAANLAITVGTNANTVGSGLRVSNANPRAVGVYTDDNGVGTAGAEFISNARFRLLCTGTTYAGEQYALHGTTKYFGTNTVSSYTSGGLDTLEWGGTAFTVNGYGAGSIARIGGGAIQAAVGSGGILAGFIAANNMASAHTGAGVTAAFAPIITNTQNWDYGLYIPASATDTGISIGTCTTGILLPATYTRGIDFVGATLAATTDRSKSLFSMGTRAAALTLTMASGSSNNHFDPMQMNYSIAGVNPSSTSTVNSIYGLITHSTADMANLRLKTTDWNIVVQKNLQDAYVVQAELDFSTNAVTVGGEACGIGVTVDGGTAGITGNVWGQITMMTATGALGSVSAIHKMDVRGTATVTHGIYFETLASTTLTNLLYLNNGGTVTNFFQGTTENGAIGATRATPNTTLAADGSLKVKIGAKTLYIPLVNAVTVT